jgi:hypothetical protein
MERAVDRHFSKYSSRIALLLVRVLFSSEQIRNMLTEVLHHLPDVPEDEVLGKEEVVRILDWAANLAKNKISSKTPELEEALATVEAWFMEEPQEKEKHE